MNGKRRKSGAMAETEVSAVEVAAAPSVEHGTVEVAAVAPAQDVPPMTVAPPAEAAAAPPLLDEYAAGPLLALSGVPGL